MGATKKKSIAAASKKNADKAPIVQNSVEAPAKKTKAKKTAVTVEAPLAPPVIASAPVAPTSALVTAPLSAGATASTTVRDVLGNRLMTRSHAINCVLMRATEALKTKQIEALALASEEGREYARINGRQLGAVGRHLDYLFAMRLVTKDASGWRYVDGASKEKWRAEEKAKIEALNAAAPK